MSIYGAVPTTAIGPYHYLYRITNVVENKHYYGIRTSKNLLPKEDLGKKYLSSSQNKEFIKNQKEYWNLTKKELTEYIDDNWYGDFVWVIEKWYWLYFFNTQ